MGRGAYSIPPNAQTPILGILGLEEDAEMRREKEGGKCAANVNHFACNTVWMTIAIAHEKIAAAPV